MKKFFKDIVRVSFGNVAHLVSGVLAGFLLPLILSVEDYGYYKTYTLYVTYAGLLHLGFVDGILLTYGGTKYEELNKTKFRSYTKFFILLESILAFIVSLISFIALKGSIRVIIIFAAVNIIWSNITLYYQYVSQATFRFREFSFRKVLQAVLLIGILVILFILKKSGITIDYSKYIIIVQLISAALLFWYVYTYKEITLGQAERIIDNKSEIVSILRKGIMLTVAYEVSTLALQLDRQFVSILFGIEIYAKYAFAYNILSCVTALIRSVSTVLFPQLKRMKSENALGYFATGMAAISIIVFGFQLGYYPVRWIVEKILPVYVDSLVYFQIIFPVLALSSCVTIICYTFYKLLNRTKELFLIGLCSLITSAVFNYIAYSVWKSPVAISVASLFSTMVWYLMAVLFLHKKYFVAWRKNFAYCLIMIASFYTTTFLVKNEAISIILYFTVFCIATIGFYRDILRSFLHIKTARQ